MFTRFTKEKILRSSNLKVVSDHALFKITGKKFKKINKLGKMYILTKKWFLIK